MSEVFGGPVKIHLHLHVTFTGKQTHKWERSLNNGSTAIFQNQHTNHEVGLTINNSV